MTKTFRPSGVCSNLMTVKVDEGIVKSVEIVGGCSGNGQGISRLVEGMTVVEAVSRLKGIRCGGKPTSCPDQLARVLETMK